MSRRQTKLKFTGNSYRRPFSSPGKNQQSDYEIEKGYDLLSYLQLGPSGLAHHNNALECRISPLNYQNASSKEEVSTNPDLDRPKDVGKISWQGTSLRGQRGSTMPAKKGLLRSM